MEYTYTYIPTESERERNKMFKLLMWGLLRLAPIKYYQLNDVTEGGINMTV